MASVISEFLASVGFAVDEKSLKASITKVAAFGAAIKLVTAGIIAGVTKVATAEAELAVKAEQLGTTTDKLREMQYVAEQSGASIDSVTAAMQSLVSKNPRIRDSAAALEEVSRRMQGMSDAQRRVYASRMGIDPKLIPMLTSDVAGLKAEFREMYAVAGMDAKKAAKDSRELLGEIGKLKSLKDLLASSVAAQFMGRIRDGIKSIRLFIIENFARIKAVLASVIDFFLRLSDGINALVSRVAKWASALLSWYDKLDDGQKNLVIGLGLFLAAWKLLNLGFLATPLGMIITGLLAIVVLIDDYLTYMEGGDSYFGEKWEEWAEAIELVISFLKMAWGLIKAVAQGLLSALGPAIETVKTFLKNFINWLTTVIKFWKALFAGNFEEAAELAWQSLAAFITMVKDNFWGLIETLAAFFKGLWAGIEENFPDFAGWAKEAAASIGRFFGPAIAKVKAGLDKIIGALRWAGKKLGLIDDDDDGPADGPSDDPDILSAPSQQQIDPEIKKNILEGVMASTMAAMAAVVNVASSGSNPALIPSPAEAASINNINNSKEISMQAETTINVTASDPVSAGRQVAGQQDRVNADLARNLKGAVK